MGKPKVIPVDCYDFTRTFCADQFRTNLGLNDGCVSKNCDGLTLNSRVFQETVAAGENGEYRANGWLDNFKLALYTRRCFEVPHCEELVLDTGAAAVQFFNAGEGAEVIPSAFTQRVRNIRADPRLANGSIGFLQPETGVIIGFTITDHVIHAMYGRLPYARASDTAEWMRECSANRECAPCKTGCTPGYGADNYHEDPRYKSFKQTTSQREWMQFLHYVRWRHYCHDHGCSHDDWKRYGTYCREVGPLSCDVYTRESWVNWISVYDFSEYNFYYDWLSWRELEIQFGVVNEYVCKGGCRGVSSVYTHNVTSAPHAKCSRDGCSNCWGVKKEEASTQPVEELKREEYAYQWGKIRCCCAYHSASFLSLKEVARTEACDPSVDYHCLSIGIDRSHSTIRWYVNNVEVFKHVGIGRRTAEEYRVREHGGYAETVDITNLVAFMATGSLLDASMPDNYNRYRAENKFSESTGLVPLLCKEAYFFPYFNKFGELIPTSDYPSLAWGVLGGTANKDHPDWAETNPNWRIFGQGAILRVKHLNIFKRPLDSKKVYALPDCYTCFGPTSSASCGHNGHCCDYYDRDASCGKNCDKAHKHDHHCGDCEEYLDVWVPDPTSEGDWIKGYAVEPQDPASTTNGVACFQHTAMPGIDPFAH